MTRRARRDPRSLLELRRLALRAPRDHDARLVLVDALLETVPRVFERYIEQANTEDERSGLEQLVWFRPERMRPYRREMPEPLFGEPIPRKKLTRWSPLNWFYTSAERTKLWHQSDFPPKTNDIETALQRVNAALDLPTKSHVIVYRTRGYL